MAELIPLEYRIQVARRRHISRWTMALIVTVLMVGGVLAYTVAWQQRQARELARLSDEFRAKSAVIAQAKELQSKRLDLAARMQKMQQLMDDKTLLSLLRNVSEAFSSSDMLSYISIDAHGGPRQSVPKTQEDYKYSVRLTGVTASDTSHADLISRLTEIGKKSSPPIEVNPESLRRENLYDGQVMRFQITCGKPEAKGG
jgi:hypothetical protein